MANYSIISSNPFDIVFHGNNLTIPIKSMTCDHYMPDPYKGYNTTRYPYELNLILYNKDNWEDLVKAVKQDHHSKISINGINMSTAIIEYTELRMCSNPDPDRLYIWSNIRTFPND